MQFKQDRDAIIVLLALGAAMADQKLAAKLNLNGIPRKQKILRDVAASVQLLQSGVAVGDFEANQAQHTLFGFLAKLGISKRDKTKVKDLVIDAANEYGMAARGRRWAKAFFTSASLIPKGTRAEVIAILREHGFTDEDADIDE